MTDGMTALLIIALLTAWLFGFAVGYGIRGGENEHYYLQRDRVRQQNRQTEAVPEITPTGTVRLGGIFTSEEPNAS